MPDLDARLRAAVAAAAERTATPPFAAVERRHLARRTRRAAALAVAGAAAFAAVAVAAARPHGAPPPATTPPAPPTYLPYDALESDLTARRAATHCLTEAETRAAEDNCYRVAGYDPPPAARRRAVPRAFPEHPTVSPSPGAGPWGTWEPDVRRECPASGFAGGVPVARTTVHDGRDVDVRVFAGAGGARCLAFRFAGGPVRAVFVAGPGDDPVPALPVRLDWDGEGPAAPVLFFGSALPDAHWVRMRVNAVYYDAEPVRVPFAPERAFWAIPVLAGDPLYFGYVHRR